jgi:uncharacterized protein (TIGR02231 family)
MPDMKIYTKKLVSVFAFLICLTPANSRSAPREVTFFPESAQVLEVAKVKLQTEGKDIKKTVFILPGQADPNSLVTRLPHDSKMRIDDQVWRQVFRQDDIKISTLRKQLEQRKNERKILQASIRSLDAQIQFWQLQTKAKVKTIADAHNMAAAIGKNIKKTYQDKLSQESELEMLDKQIINLRDDLDRAAGKKETAWEVTLLFSGSRNTEETLTYMYSLTGCGWQPLYRLEAKPQDKQILFTWEAEISQSSGQDWNDVSINLATLKPPTSTAPADLPPWIIKPRPVYRLEGVRKRAMKGEAAEDRAEVLAAPVEASSAPRQIRQSTYSLWQIGKKNVPAGSKQKVKLYEEIWPSEFIFLARPSQSNQVFVRASVKYTEPKEIPSGSTLFMIDGAILGKRDFALAGQEASIFFGTDPIITTSAQLLSKKSGEKNFLQDKQTYSWDWRIDVQNSRTSPVRVVLEEPNPQLRDERIIVSLKHEPDPSEKTPSSLIWNLEIPAGQKKSLFTTVRIEAPKDMNLDLGWRR